MTASNNSEGQALRDAISSLRMAISHTQATGDASQITQETAQAAREAAQVASETAQSAREAAQVAAANALIRLEATVANRRCPHCYQLIAA